MKDKEHNLNARVMISLINLIENQMGALQMVPHALGIAWLFFLKEEKKREITFQS